MDSTDRLSLLIITVEVEANGEMFIKNLFGEADKEIPDPTSFQDIYSVLEVTSVFVRDDHKWSSGSCVVV